MILTQPITAQLAVNVAAAGNTADFDTKYFERVAVDIQLATLTGGTAPAVTFIVERKDANGNYITLFSFTALTAVGFTSQDIGPGLQTNKMVGSAIRLRWTVTGAPATATANLSILGDADG